MGTQADRFRSLSLSSRYVRSHLNLLVLVFGIAALASVAAQEPQKPEPVKTQASAVAPKVATTKRIGGSIFLNCPFCDLHGMDLSNKDLSNVNLSGADLTGANLTNAQLNGAALLRANLTDAILTNANLGGANLTAANLTRAKLGGARLDGAILAYANLTCSDLSNTDTRRAHLGPTLRIDQGAACQTKFRNAALSCEFKGDWKKLDMTGAKLPPCIAQAVSSYYCAAADVSKLTNVIYVSATLGTDSDTCGASLTQQCQTIQKGISRCSGANCNVLVDYNAYSPTTTITLADGVNVYGGCATQTQPDPTYFSLINAPNGGVPGVTAVSTQTATLFQGFTIMGSNAVTGSANLSSVGFLAQSNAALTLAYVTISAGAGAKGGQGANGVAGNQGDSAQAQTGGRSCAWGGDGAATNSSYNTSSMVCPSTPGGTRICWVNNVGGRGLPGGSGTYSAGGGSGSNANYACPDTERPGAPGNGNPGSPGGCSSGGTPSSNTVGSIQNGIWIPSVGGTGQNGYDGGGGGGGGSGGNCAYVGCFSEDPDIYNGAAGGGGGGGGCAGTGGVGGQQGGASIALTINGGAVALNNASIIGGIGGAGGQGGNGLGGGTGGAGAPGVAVSSPCNNGGGAGGTGGPGGTGGAGSGGAGGNGGPAFGLITFSGGTFTQTATNFTLGSSGQPGTFGTGGVNSPGGSCAGQPGMQGVAGTVSNQQSF